MMVTSYKKIVIEGEGGLVEAADDAVVAQWEGGAEDGLEGEGGS